MKENLVSIIMPVYNSNEFLDKAINSCLGQTYTNVQLVICDDCSTDGKTPDIIENYAKNDSRIKFIRNERNLGPFKTLQHCFEETDGEYVIRVDSDDVLSENSIELLLRFLKENDLDIACTKVLHLDGKDNLILENVYSNYSKDIILKDRKDYRKLLSSRYINAGMLAKKEFLLKENYSFFECKELYFVEMFFFDNCKVGFMQEPTYFYRIYGSNNSVIWKSVRNNKNDDNYFDRIPDFKNKISDKTVRTYAEMLFLRARCPIAIIRSLNEGEEYKLSKEMRRLKRGTNYNFFKMAKCLPYFSKRNVIIGISIMFRTVWLARLYAKLQYKKQLKNINK